MNNDKVYITFCIRPTLGFVLGKGCVFDINLYNILKYKFYKYNAFNIKLESIQGNFNEAGGTTGERNYYLHLSGLNWINGYDTLTSYSDSRVLDVVAQQPFIGSQNAGVFSFVSNCNAISFYRPSTPSVQLTFFYTDSNGLFYDRLNSGGDNLMTFSITGIDAYKVQNPSKGLRYSYQTNLSSTFTIKYYDGESIDPIDTTATKGRIRIFRNINIKTIIGNENYYKYNKFALVARKTSYFASSSGGAYATGNYWWTLWINFSNINFESDSVSNQTILGSGGLVPSYFYTYPQFVCSVSTTSFQRYETYYEYVFNKPSTDTTDLILAYTISNSLFLPAANTANNDLFPDFLVEFEIIPIKE